MNSSIIDALVTEGFVLLMSGFLKKNTANLWTMWKTMHGENQFTSAHIGSYHNKALNSTIRNDQILWIDEENTYLNAYLKQLKQLMDMLNRVLFLGLIEYEAHFAVYRQIAFIKNIEINSRELTHDKFQLFII